MRPPPPAPGRRAAPRPVRLRCGSGGTRASRNAQKTRAFQRRKVAVGGDSRAPARTRSLAHTCTAHRATAMALVMKGWREESETPSVQQRRQAGEAREASRRRGDTVVGRVASLNFNNGERPPPPRKSDLTFCAN